MARPKTYKTVVEYKHFWYENNRERILNKQHNINEQNKSKNTKNKKCPICQTYFTTHIDRVIFCSDACRKEGSKARSDKFGKTHKADKREYDKEYRMKNMERKKYLGRLGHLKRKFGLSLDDYNDLFESQKGKCAICGRHQSELKRSLYVDHDHVTKRVRGLLCYNCNSLLGQAKDSIANLQHAIEYLHKAGK